ncbi:MAG: hypothetical protein AAF218_00950 [Pseudomonadota bacterium]
MSSRFDAVFDALSSGPTPAPHGGPQNTFGDQPVLQFDARVDRPKPAELSGFGQDTLRLDVSRAQWQLADVRAEVGKLAAFLRTNRSSAELFHGWQAFRFDTLKLSVRGISSIALFVDGAPTDPEAPPPQIKPAPARRMTGQFIKTPSAVGVIDDNALWTGDPIFAQSIGDTFIFERRTRD